MSPLVKLEKDKMCDRLFPNFTRHTLSDYPYNHIFVFNKCFKEGLKSNFSLHFQAEM